MFFRPFSFYRDVNSPSAPPQPGGGLDPNAEAFLTATGITDETITDAINNLVLDLKAENLWTEMQAIYPFVGGTATTHKYNLVNPLDTDAAFRLGFNGGWTHDSNGITGNATNTYATTWMDLQALGTSPNNCHFSMYVRNIPTARNGTDLGVNNGTSYAFFNPRNGSNLAQITLNTNSAGSTQSFTGSSGFFGASRQSSATQVMTINTTQYSFSKASVSTTGNTRDIFIGAYNNNGTAAFFQNRNYALCTLGFGLSDAEMDTLAGINETFQTALGRFA
jgi:hypothetical protein